MERKKITNHSIKKRTGNKGKKEQRRGDGAAKSIMSILIVLNIIIRIIVITIPMVRKWGERANKE